MEGSLRKLLLLGILLLIHAEITQQTGTSSYIHQYILFTKMKLDWMEAQGHCRAKYSDLATVSDEQDVSRINSLSKDLNITFWIGLYDDVSGWKWSLEGEGFYTGVDVGYRQWQEGQPDNSGAVEHCASMMLDGHWRDDNCMNVKAPLICFNDGAVDQYVLVSEEMTWFEAQSYCRQHYTDLVSVRSSAENEDVRGRLQGIPAWIGLHRDSWRWSDGSHSSFRHWMESQPDNQNSREACVIVLEGGWNDWACDTKFNFLCQRIIEVTPPPQVMLRRTSVKITFRTNADLKDPTIIDGVIQQLEASLRSQGLSNVHVIGGTLLPGNVATRGTAVQSEDSDSQEPASPAAAPHLANDQDFSPQTFEETCTTVPKQNNPWWQVDLGSIYHITAVSIISNGDCCPEELEGAEIRIGLRNDTNNHRCAVITFAQGQYKYNFDCEITEARFVHVVLPGEGKTLTLCEVQVFGTVLENVAVRGVGLQSSLRSKTAGRASSVIDGNRITTCSITEDNPVSGCLVMSNSSLSLVTLDCGGVVGRYVTVMHPDVPLTLCEVEVYSTWEHPENTFPQRPTRYSYCSPDLCSRDLVLVRQPKTWFEGQTYCRDKYTDLATIHGAQDMNKVIDVVGMDDSDVWIGLYEDVMTWRWSLSDQGYYGDGEAEFRNWDAGEPNSESGIQHCAGMQHTGEWKDLDCGLLNIFFCFDDKNGAETRILVETPMKWADAQNYCRRNHKDLLSVRNLPENQEIQSMVPAGQLAWIGLFGDSWKWSDGSNSIFRYWGQLDNTGTGPNCAHFDGILKTWSTRSCNSKSMFFCYYYKRKIMVKISTDFDLSDTGVQQQIIKQLEMRMKTKGISDINIKWRKSIGQK
ncbi:hypothetical protein INR49_002463 [Caranx melampygus]|nr:hypothetical protein INR49_002463 [Caranx melampygus]